MAPQHFSAAVDVQHVLQRQRLEIQPVAGVVVRADRLGVAVHHDRLEPGFAQRKRGVHAAVVELDPLADPVRTAAQNHDLAADRPAGSRRRSPYVE